MRDTELKSGAVAGKTLVPHGRLCTADHVLQIYGSEYVLLEALECFATCGLQAGEAVVIFATARHLQELEIRLQASRVQIDRARWQGRYIPLLASEVLASFMVDGRPDRVLFMNIIGKILDRAQAGGRRARAFGEMVAVLMADGQEEATLCLEQLWSEVCEERQLTLFCAYPQASLLTISPETMDAVRHQHGWVLDEYSPTPSSLRRTPLSTLLTYALNDRGEVSHERGLDELPSRAIFPDQLADSICPGNNWILRPLQ